MSATSGNLWRLTDGESHSSGAFWAIPATSQRTAKVVHRSPDQSQICQNAIFGRQMIFNLAAERLRKSHVLLSAAMVVAQFALCVVLAAQTAPNPTHSEGSVARALAAELDAAQDTRHPMQYRLRKSTPRLTSTKEIVETSDG